MRVAAVLQGRDIGLGHGHASIHTCAVIAPLIVHRHLTGTEREGSGVSDEEIGTIIDQLVRNCVLSRNHAHSFNIVAQAPPIMRELRQKHLSEIALAEEVCSHLRLRPSGEAGGVVLALASAPKR